ncbi:MAG: hypothetical protein H7123_02180, partial [Thermoleophilia bacterium]|nr:hypothetical protein [Thermoleophilia bacterium]
GREMAAAPLAHATTGATAANTLPNLQHPAVPKDVDVDGEVEADATHDRAGVSTQQPILPPRKPLVTERPTDSE